MGMAGEWLRFGDCLDAIPCVGGCMGLLADFVETYLDASIHCRCMAGYLEICWKATIPALQLGSTGCDLVDVCWCPYFTLLVQDSRENVRV